MADKQEDVCGDEDESLCLRGDLVAVVSQRLGTVFQGYRREVAEKVLHRRRRKWQKRHKLDPPSQVDQPLDPALLQEREGRLQRLIEAKAALSRRRKEGMTISRELQRDTGTLCLKILTGRIDAAHQTLHNYREAHAQTDSTQTTPTSSSTVSLGERVVQDLEDTLSQAQALASIHKMKLHMTPRVPVLNSTQLDESAYSSSEADPFVLGKTVEVNTTVTLDGRDTPRGDGRKTATVSSVVSSLRIVAVTECRNMELSTSVSKNEAPPTETSSAPTLVGNPEPSSEPDQRQHGSVAVEICSSPVPEYEREISVSSSPEPIDDSDNTIGPSAPKSPRLDGDLNGVRDNDEHPEAEGDQTRVLDTSPAAVDIASSRPATVTSLLGNSGSAVGSVDARSSRLREVLSSLRDKSASLHGREADTSKRQRLRAREADATDPSKRQRLRREPRTGKSRRKSRRIKK